MDLTVTLDAESATSGQLTLGGLTGRARVMGDNVTLDPIAFNVFGGRYEGALALTLGSAAPSFAFKAKLSGVDVADRDGLRRPGRHDDRQDDAARSTLVGAAPISAPS